jgi:O-antigen biosynthesis protein WbqP
MKLILSSTYNSTVVSYISRKLLFQFVKRIFDLLFALQLLLVLLPLFIMIVLAIKFNSKGPIIFKQKRIGKNGKVFRIFKFRTMYVGTPNTASKNICNPEKWITPVGKFLRKTSLDELPQLFNIIKGEMSFIGYRPLILEETDIHQYREEFHVYNIKPGITGYAQINGRDLVSPHDKAVYDYYYLINRGFMLDIKILFITFIKVLKREGIHDGKYMYEKKEKPIKYQK